MLNFSLSTISVRARQSRELLPPNDPDIVLVDKVITDITALEAKQASGSPYKKDEAWNEVHRLDRMLALAEPRETLLGAIQRRLNDLDDEPMASAARSRARFETLTKECLDTTQSPSTIRNGGEKLLRDFLLGLVEDIQYFHTREHSLRPLKKKLAGRVAFIGLVAFTAMLYPYLNAYWNIWNSREIPYRLSLEGWASLPLYTAVTAGLFGACFSRLHFLQMHWNEIPYGEITDALDTYLIALRACVGMTGAVVVFFFLQSGVIGGGGLVPNFSELGVAHSHFPLDQVTDPAKSKDPDFLQLHLLLPNKQLALLIVWSFLAGFSERLVPSLLEFSEGAVNAGAAARSPK